MRQAKGVFWGVVAGLDALTLLLIVTMSFGNNSVLYWLWDTSAGVWLFAAAGAMLGLSFGTSNIETHTNKDPRGVSSGSVLHYQSIRPSTDMSREERVKSENSLRKR